MTRNTYAVTVIVLNSGVVFLSKFLFFLFLFYRNFYRNFCKFCNEVESESHFILFCKTYDTFRDRLLKEFDIDKLKLCKDKEFDTLKLILNPRNRAQATMLSKYLSKALEIRDS